MAQTCHAAVFLGNDAYEVREFPVPDPPAGGDARMFVLLHHRMAT